MVPTPQYVRVLNVHSCLFFEIPPMKERTVPSGTRTTYSTTTQQTPTIIISFIHIDCTVHYSSVLQCNDNISIHTPLVASLPISLEGSFGCHYSTSRGTRPWNPLALCFESHEEDVGSSARYGMYVHARIVCAGVVFFLTVITYSRFSP